MTTVLRGQRSDSLFASEVRLGSNKHRQTFTSSDFNTEAERHAKTHTRTHTLTHARSHNYSSTVACFCFTSVYLESLALIIPLIIILMGITDLSENVEQMRKNHTREASKIITLSGVQWPTHNDLFKSTKKRDVFCLFFFFLFNFYFVLWWAIIFLWRHSHSHMSGSRANREVVTGSSGNTVAYFEWRNPRLRLKEWYSYIMQFTEQQLIH